MSSKFVPSVIMKGALESIYGNWSGGVSQEITIRTVEYVFEFEKESMTA